MFVHIISLLLVTPILLPIKKRPTSAGMVYGRGNGVNQVVHHSFSSSCQSSEPNRALPTCLRNSFIDALYFLPFVIGGECYVT
jgi:hypothetical protein